LKKLSPRFRRWLLARSQNQQRRKLKRDRGQGGALLIRSRTSWALGGFEKLEPPTVFCLETNYEETAKCINALRQSLLNQASPGQSKPKGAYIDFPRIEYMSISAALVLAAEYDRVQRKTRRPVFPVDMDQWHPEVRRLLDEIGFLSLLGIRKAQNATYEKSQNVHALRFRSGRYAQSEDLGQVSQSLRQLFPGLTEEYWMAQYGGLIEAINNVIDHAYPSDYNYKFPHVGRWWVTGEVNNSEKSITIATFDQGISIPGSLPRSSIWGSFSKYFFEKYEHIPVIRDVADDVKQIAAAIEVSRTSTGQSGRGLGLAQIRNVVEEADSGSLRILSRNGEYQYTKGKGETLRNHGISIGGTFVEWKVSHTA